MCYRFNRYIYRRQKAKSSRRSILRASSSKWLWYDSKHSTTNLMYRTAKGISPFMVLQRCSSVSSSLAFPPPFSHLTCLHAASLLFCHSIFLIFCFRSLNHRSALKTDTILIIKAGCDSRTLWQTNFDGKSMPCLSSGCRYLRFPRTLHAPFASNFPLFFFFVYGNLQAMMAKYFLASLILLLKCVYPVFAELFSFLFALSLFSLFLLSFSLFSYPLCFLLRFDVWRRFIFPLARQIV